MTTTSKRPCKNCTTVDGCGCTAHAPATLTASATAPVTNPLACNCGVYDARTVSGVALTASVASVTDSNGPYPQGMSPDIGEALMDGQAGQSFAESYRATMTRHGVDCPVYGVMAACARGVMPAAERRALRRFEMVGETVSRSRSDVLVAAAVAPLGQQVIVEEAPRYPSPVSYYEPTARFDVPELDQFDMVRSLYRDLGSQLLPTGDPAQAANIAATLADQLRRKAVESGALIDDGLTAAGKAYGKVVAAARAQGDDIPAFIGATIGLRGQGHLDTAADLLATLADEVRAEATKQAFDKAQAERDAEQTPDELAARRLQRLVASAQARATG